MKQQKIEWLTDKDIELLNSKNGKVLQVIEHKTIIKEADIMFGGPFGEKLYNEIDYYLCLIEKGD